MIDFSVSIGYDGKLGRIANALAANTQAVLQQSLVAAVPQIEQRVIPMVNEEPPPSDGVAPNWESDRQQRAYFASDGFGAGIPYQRTGKLAAAWRAFLTIQGASATIGITNPAAAAKYVYGSTFAIQPQQHFHFVTGWQPLAPQAFGVLTEITTIIVGEIRSRMPLVISEDQIS